MTEKTAIQSGEKLPNGISSEHIDKIFTALSKAQGEINDAKTNAEGKVNDKVSYDYANLHSIYEVSRKVIADNGLSVFNRFAPNNMLHIFLLHTSGQWIDYGEYPIGNVTEHKARGGALTYIRRFSLKAIFGIADAEDDAEDEKGNQALGNQPVPTHNHQESEKAAYRPSDPLRPHKDAFVVPCPIKADGTLDFDTFAADLESHITSAKDNQELSLWNRANAKTLTAMQKERLDLFDAFGIEYKKMAAGLA